MSGMEPPKWIYLSSLRQGSEGFHDALAAYIKLHPEIQLAFQPGTYQMRMGVEKLKDLYTATSVFICNKEEAARILNSENHEIRALLDGLHALGPKIVVITDGPLGAYVSENGNYWFMPPYPDPKPPYERTGAGDAFSSTFVAGLIKTGDVRTAMRWAPINSMSVVQSVGAQEGLLTETALRAYLEQAPQDYEPRPLPRR